MQVISGAGEFELSFERAEIRDASLVLIGKMGIWEAETFVKEAELGQLLRVTLTPRVLGWVLSRPFARLRRRGKAAE
jgi:hypothetical protein